MKNELMETVGVIINLLNEVLRGVDCEMECRYLKLCDTLIDECNQSLCDIINSVSEVGNGK